MPLYLVERTFGESFDPNNDVLRELDEYYDAHDIRWLTSFLSADKKKSYCLYEADNTDLLVQHAADMGIPFDGVIEVSDLRSALDR